MNAYFLVEGRRTERKVYPAWLGHLAPGLVRVERFDAVAQNNYFLFSGEGYPSLLDEHLPNAVTDVNRIGRYSHFVICLDADELSVEERRNEVVTRMRQRDCRLPGVSTMVLVQNRCIETWFLGNRKVVTRAPQSARLAQFIGFYDVTRDDPEAMGRYPGFTTHAAFHEAYLREAFLERGIRYSKTRPGHVTEKPYLEELRRRADASPRHLLTFQEFLGFCENCHLEPTP